MLALIPILLVPLALEATPLIHQIVYDGPGADADDVFTQLSGPPGFSLDQWALVGVNGHNGQHYKRVELTGLVIPSDGLVLLAGSLAHPALAAQRDAIASVDWQNGPDAVLLLDAAGQRVDALQYGVAPFFAGEGTPAPDVAAGWGLVRRNLGGDTQDNLADFLALPNALPTVPTPAPVPEAASWILLLTGFLLLAARRWTPVVLTLAYGHKTAILKNLPLLLNLGPQLHLPSVFSKGILRIGTGEQIQTCDFWGRVSRTRVVGLVMRLARGVSVRHNGKIRQPAPGAVV